MGAAATGAVSGSRARKEGQRYYWGAERPSVIERRVQLRKKQIDIEIAKIREEGEKEIARRVAAKEAEKLKVLDQEALLAEHRADVKRRREARRASSFIVPKGSFTEEQLDEFMSAHPGLTEEEARVLLSMRSRPAANSNELGAEGSDNVLSLVVGSPVPEAKAVQTGKLVESPEAVSSEKPKPPPARVQPEAASSSGSSGPQGNRDRSDFDPDAWEEGEPFPIDRFYERLNRDGYRELVPRSDLDEPEAKPVSPELQALRDRRRELEADRKRLFQEHGRKQMVWPAEVIAEAERLDQALTAVHKEIMQAQE